MMTRIVGFAASMPAFLSVAAVDILKMSEAIKVLTLLFGCAISGVMLIYWCIKARKEWTSEKLAELKLKEAEQKAQDTLAAAEKEVVQRLLIASRLAEVKLSQAVK
jgi:hypothetical protein